MHLETLLPLYMEIILDTWFENQMSHFIVGQKMSYYVVMGLDLLLCRSCIGLQFGSDCSRRLDSLILCIGTVFLLKINYKAMI